MFIASLTHTEHFGAALSRCAGVIQYQPTPYPVIALSGTESAFMVASECAEDRTFRLAPNAVQMALNLLNQDANPLWLVEGAQGLQFAASAPDQAEFEVLASVPPAILRLNPLSSIVHKAQRIGAPVIRIGMYSLQFCIGAGEFALVELLADSTWISITQAGTMKSRKSYPALSAYELLKALEFDHLMF